MAKGDGARNVERETFLTACIDTHGKMRRCFMTGKPCVYEEVISRRLEEVASKKRSPEGFVVMAYRPNLNAFYDWSLSRLFQSKYGTEPQFLKRADQVRKTGYVICEKICRRIQEASFVVVDVSVDNANVFYEFGLAFGLRRKLIVAHDTNSASAGLLRTRFIPDDMQPKTYAYPSLRPIDITETFSQRLYTPPEAPFPESLRNGNPHIVILDLSISQPDERDSSGRRADDKKKEPSDGRNTPSVAPDEQDDIPLSFMDVIKGAVGVSVENIADNLSGRRKTPHIPQDYLGIIRAMRHDIKEFGADTPFDMVRSNIDSAFSVLIRTSKTHPFSYFWLGYCHATGKNVIPICEVANDEEDIKDLAFDIRSLWHLVLVKNEPTRILSELEEILDQMILTDFSERSRKAFWSRIFGRSGRVSIFTGALHSPDLGREMVGDWDLRTASELTSYFSTHQRLSTIESPMYQPEHVKIGSAKYRQQLEGLLADKNAIVIASPDVNPMTELLLGQLYGIPDDVLFSSSFSVGRYPRAIVAVKKRSAKAKPTGKKSDRFFFVEELNKEDEEKRGFRASWLENAELLEEYLSQQQCKDRDFQLYAHLVIALNPVVSSNAPEESGNHYVVILNGISGPSTFALTHLLTGGIGEEFVNYGTPPSATDSDKPQDRQYFDPDLNSESILRRITEKFDQYVHDESDFCGVQMIVEVTVGPPSPHVTQLATYDIRRVKSWKLVSDTLRLIERV